MLPTREKTHVIRLKTINELTSHPKKPTIERGKEIQEMRTLSKKSISLGLTSEICNIIFQYRNANKRDLSRYDRVVYVVNNLAE